MQLRGIAFLNMQVVLLIVKDLKDILAVYCKEKYSNCILKHGEH